MSAKGLKCLEADVEINSSSLALGIDIILSLVTAENPTLYWCSNMKNFEFSYHLNG